eukprot:350891-Chlamydomonas_euryale.AAC.1
MQLTPRRQMLRAGQQPPWTPRCTREALPSAVVPPPAHLAPPPCRIASWCRMASPQPSSARCSVRPRTEQE